MTWVPPRLRGGGTEAEVWRGLTDAWPDCGRLPLARWVRGPSVGGFCSALKDIESRALVPAQQKRLKADASVVAEVPSERPRDWADEAEAKMFGRITAMLEELPDAQRAKALGAAPSYTRRPSASFLDDTCTGDGGWLCKGREVLHGSAMRTESASVTLCLSNNLLEYSVVYCLHRHLYHALRSLTRGMPTVRRHR